MPRLFEISRRRGRVALVVVGLAAPVAGFTTLAVTGTSPATAKTKCPTGKKHFKTPHKDLDRDKCDSRGLDDGDGAKI